METLCDVPNLGSVMSLCRFEECAELDEQCRTAGRMETLDVWVMVATGVGTPGVRIEGCFELIEQIREACPRLKFCGISGVTGGVGGGGPSRDGLEALFLARRVIAERLGCAPEVRFDRTEFSATDSHPCTSGDDARLWQGSRFDHSCGAKFRFLIRILRRALR